MAWPCGWRSCTCLLALRGSGEMPKGATKILLKGGRVLDPEQGIDGILDVLIDHGVVEKIGENISLEPPSGEVIMVGGKIVVPGLIDMHTHLREPGYEYKETIATGSQAAAAGGFTAIACMANTHPVNDNRSVTEFIIRNAQLSGWVRVYPVSSLSICLEGKQLVEFWDQKDAGAVAVSDDGRPVMDSALMRRAMEYAGSLGLPIISHCEDISLSVGCAAHEGSVSVQLGLRGAPSIAEEIMVAREAMLGEYTGAPVHIAHVSTAGSVRIIREAKARGVRITAETAPHYFTLTDESLNGFDVNAKVNPPLRGREDLMAIHEGLRDGTIDVIASDHAPHAVTDKELEFEYAASGISGLETSLGLSLSLVSEGVLTLADLVKKMSSLPAKILGIVGGSLKPGMPADITVIDMNREWTVDASTFRSKGKNTPFHGRRLKGKAVLTIMGGKITHKDE